MFGRDVEKLETYALLVGRGSVQPLWKRAWRFLKKFIIELCIQKFHFTSEYIYKKMKAQTQINVCTPSFTAALFTVVKLETTQMLTDR